MSTWTEIDVWAEVENTSTTLATEQAVGVSYMPTIGTSSQTITFTRSQGRWFPATTGVTTSATTTVLTDTNLSLTVNALKGAYLTYTTGPAAGLRQQILSNTATTITTGTFSGTPTSGGGDSFAVTGGIATIKETHTCASNPIVGNGPNALGTNYWYGAGSSSTIPVGT